MIEYIENFEKVCAYGRGRCESCITPRRLEARIAELFEKGECKTTEDMEALAESVCGPCLSECMGTSYDDKAIFILLEAKPERRKRKRV